MKIYKHSEYNYVTIVEIPKNELKRIDMSLCEQPRETLKAFYNRQSVKPDFLINGGFFSMADGVTCFNYIDEEDVVSEDDAYKYGFGIVDEISLMYGRVDGRTDWRDFISAYPPLVVNGTRCSVSYATEINYDARRSVLGYNNHSIFLITIEAPGMNFEAAAKLAINVGCTYAVNLDGGGSTKLLHNGKSLTSVFHNRAVDNVIAIYLKHGEEPVEPEVKTIYRVQTGAYRNKSGAESLAAKIRELPDDIGAGYKNAYIRLVNGLYKVQVGAFSVKDSAEKVVNDLKTKGYNSFITTS